MKTITSLFVLSLSLASIKAMVTANGQQEPCCCVNGRDGQNGRDGRDGQSLAGPAGRDGKDGKDGLNCKDCTQGPVFSKGLTCKDLKAQGYPSGEYYINLASGVHRVYCEMAINGGGYTFLPIASIPKLIDEDVDLLFKNKQDVLLRIARTDGTQPFTIISQYQNTGGLPVRLNSYAPGAAPYNAAMGKYLYLETRPNLNAASGSTAGFKANGQDILYSTCHGDVKGNYFAFFANQDERAPSAYHSENLAYEDSGVAVNWRSKAVNPNSMRRMAEDFFMFTEIHYVGCGCYTSSDRWLGAKVPALGTAIGLR